MAVMHLSNKLGGNIRRTLLR